MSQAATPGAEKYVQRRDGNWYVGGSRVEVYSVIAAWQQGFSPEEVQTSFPALSLSEVYGTILYYLDHKDEMEAYFRETDALGERLRAETEAANGELYRSLRERLATYRAAQQSRDTAVS